MPYSTDNVFAKILRGEILCAKLYENEYALSFKDINPQAPIHALVIPKGPYVDFADFAQNATDAEIAGFNRAVATVAAQLEVTAAGYRLIVNSGVKGGQEVPHYHVHIMGGLNLGPMLSRA